MPPTSRFAFRPVPAALALAFYAAGAAANPQGGVVKAGSATIAQNGSRLDVIQSSQRAVIDWRSFSIGAGGHVNFKQPSAAGATLNRVTGPEMSAILGRLTANGTVFLVNPNGILIGPNAKIDVGGLVAATANISNENFMAGRYKFDEVVNRNAVIVNRGEITAHAGGLVALVAPGVENSGVIRAELGRVVLASGNRFTLDLFGDKLVTFAVDDKVAARLTDVDGRPLTAYVNQTGRIEADGGSILIAASAAKAVLDNVINTSGVVRATSFVQRGGEIVLNGGDEGVVRVAGALDASSERASGASGGSVKVLGAEVVLDAGSRIDVAGDVGGGIAFVGGAGRGVGDLQRSSRTAIEAGATVSADALTRGNGGTIVAWSDGETRFAGSLSARGGPATGNGGLVEVSGDRGLSFAGSVDVAAPAGKGGELLLAPDVLVVDATTAMSISNALRAGANQVRTTADTIDVRERIDGRGGAAGAGLKLEAGIAIAVNNDIITNDGPVMLSAGAGGIAMNAGPSTSVSGGNGTLIHTGVASISLAATGNVTGEYLVTSGPVTLTSAAGTVKLNRDLGGLPGEGIGALAVSAGKDAWLRGVRSTGAVNIDTLSSGRTITLDGPISAEGKVTIGSFLRRESTTIRLRRDIHTEGADIELNGVALVNPKVSADSVLILRDPPIPFLTSDGTLYENVLVQVSLQTTGSGSVRLNGDALWDYMAPPNNAVQSLYNLPEPYPDFPRNDTRLVGDLRDVQLPRPTGYYGLNIKVDQGTVQFGRHLGTLDRDGVSTAIPPVDPLGAANPANGLFVTVNISGVLRVIGFDAASKAEVSRLQVAPASAAPRNIGTGNLGMLGGRPQAYKVLFFSNLPTVTVEDGNPGLIGPGPRNVNPPEAGSFAAVPRLPDVLVQGDPGLPPGDRATRPEAGDIATRVDRAGSMAAGALDATGTADLGRGAAPSGAAADVFEEGAPLALVAGETAGADREYFSHGAFEFLEVQSRRTNGNR